MNPFIKPKRAVNRVFLHCSASDNPLHDNVKTINEWHLARGFTNGIGYHFYIDKAGTLHNGRSLEMIPAAQAGHNTGTIAICLGGLLKEKFTKEQFATLKTLCNQIKTAYSGNVTFHGHCEVSRKTCPVFDYKKALGLDVLGRMA